MFSLAVAAPAAAITVDPGDGAVIYNPDLSPIGSELLYGGDPQYLFTTVTGDDDFWGLDINGLPANDDGDFDPLVTGIPLGFTISLGGVDYDGVVVQENGAVCLTSTTDPGGDPASSDWECWFYAFPPALTTSDSHYESGQARAFFAAVVADHYVQDDFPIDTDSDTVHDACAYGGYYFATGDVCSSIFWGTTTYEGKPAFVATYYFAPDIDVAADTDVAQILLVDEGAGNATIVYNVDRFLNGGYTLNYWGGDIGFEDCDIAYADGDVNAYSGMGAAFRSPGGATGFIDLFGPACIGGLDPTLRDDLIDGGASAFNENSLNSTQPGRYILYVRDDLLTLDLASDGGAELAATGGEVSSLLVAFGGGLLGLGLVAAVFGRHPGRRKSRAVHRMV